jgi:hypothetical protein
VLFRGRHISSASIRPFPFPYLEDLTRRLNHQYLLVFLAKPEKKPGLRSVRVRTEVPNAELVAASRVLVPAAS